MVLQEQLNFCPSGYTPYSTRNITKIFDCLLYSSIMDHNKQILSIKKPCILNFWRKEECRVLHRFGMNYNGKAKASTPITMLVNIEKLHKPANQMPEVSALWFLNRGFYIARFDIDGYFSTAKGVEFLNDAIARFVQTYGEDAVKPAVPPAASPDFHRLVVLHLKDFTANLDSLRAKVANKAPLNVEALDETFWAMKLWMERQLSQNRIPSESELEAVGSSYSPHKERSTIRAKARSIYRWYALRGFEPTYDARKRFKGDSPMTRQEACRVANQAKTARVKAKIEQAINLLKMQGEKITVRKVAEFAQVGHTTAAKYLKELRSQGAI